MVFLNRILLAKPKKPLRKYVKSGFLDSIRIYVRGGAGGNGLPKFGGVGGQGGSVVVVANNSLSLEDVLKKYPSKKVLATHGSDSTHNFILGQPGANVEIEVPAGVSIITDLGKKLGELNEEGEKLLIAKGGTAGHPKNGYLGTRGQEYGIKLDLKLIADIGLVGFPNAGKSTFLKAFSHAKPKIASYPFTTIKPNVGIMEFKDLRQISVADLPGLIEGAHKNQGMGHQFLKHVERTKLLLLIVDVNGFQLSPRHAYRNCFENIILLNKELEMYNADLIKKPAAIIINKMDTDGAAEKLLEVKDKLKNMERNLNDLPEEYRPETLLHFDEVLAISAKSGVKDEIDFVKDKLRFLLDLYASNEEEDESVKNLAQNLKDKLKEKRPVLV